MRTRPGTWKPVRAVALAALALVVLLGIVAPAPYAGAGGEGRLRPPDVKSRSIRLPERLQVTSGALANAHRAPSVNATAAVVTLDAGMPFTMLGLQCNAMKGDGAVVVRLRTSVDGATWSSWYEAPLELAGEAGSGVRAFTEALWTGEGRHVQVTARSLADSAPVALEDVRLVALDTKGERAIGGRTMTVVRRLAGLVGGLGVGEPAIAAVAEPSMVTRAAWGADESLRTGSPVLAPVKMAFIHHTAGGNTYTQLEAPGVVRGIYAYHTQALGWSDIGYNFLVDRFGTIYEGRAGGVREGVVGAQVYGFNTGSTGVSVLGTYTSEVPPAPAMTALERLLAWKLGLHGVDPQGTATMVCGGAEKYSAGQTVAFPVIAGHRDANYTACPGDRLYGQLPVIRSAVASLQSSSATESDGATQPAAPLPKWAVSLSRSPAQITAYERVTLSGTVKTAAGKPATGAVTLQKRPLGGDTWSTWRTVTLLTDGSYATSVRMTVAQVAQVRARMPGNSANSTGFSASRTITVLPQGATPAPASSETSFAISGRGWGHGIGMSQWGAHGLAKKGSDYREILKHYYAGIGFSEIGNSTLRVLLARNLPAVNLSCSYAFSVRGSAASFNIPAGTTATTKLVDGRYRVQAGSWSRDFTSAVTFTPSQGQLKVLTKTDAGVTGPHRGTVRVAAASGSLMMINNLGLEGYLRGVVPFEVSASWPAEALKAQACAARAFAERARRSASGAYDVYCDTRSQVYGGTSREDPRVDAAVTATAGVVPSTGGAPIQAFYFSCSGGRTENVELAWETSPISYLKSVDDPYDDAAPLHTWGPVQRTSSQLTASLGSAVKGSLQAVYTVERGVSPRIVKAAIIGSEGVTFMHGSTLRMKLGLNSAWATIKSISVSPAPADNAQITKGGSVSLQGRVYPALSAGASIKLYINSGGVWRSQEVSTTRGSRSLPDGYAAGYSGYSVTVSPATTTQYYFQSGNAKTPTTTIRVQS